MTQFQTKAEAAEKPLFETCQFCGSSWVRFGGHTVHFECGTATWIVGEWQGVPEHRHWNQSSICKDRQIAQLTEHLEAWRGLKFLVKELSRPNGGSWSITEKEEAFQKLRDLKEIE